MSKHILIAQQQGPKAGFNAYMATTVHTAAERQADIRSAGNKKAQFERYCAIFGDQFGTVKGAGAVRSEAQRESVAEKLARLLSRDTDTVGVQVEATPAVDPIVAAIADKLGVSVETLANLVSDETVEAPVSKPAPKVEREIPTATRISWPMVTALIKASKANDVEFEITGKTGGAGTGKPASYAVKYDGRKLTPARASEIIGEFKAA